MTALHAGLLCTSMMLSACACLYSCISAVVHKLLKAQMPPWRTFTASNTLWI